jgi:hypothetical protein
MNAEHRPNAIQLAAKLYECRNAARSLLGAHYKRDMALWATAIRSEAQTKKCSELAAATDMAKEAGGFGAITILAAFTEMADPQ